jgi:hypothetical protein
VPTALDNGQRSPRKLLKAVIATPARPKILRFMRTSKTER